MFFGNTEAIPYKIHGFHLLYIRLVYIDRGMRLDNVQVNTDFFFQFLSDNSACFRDFSGIHIQRYPAPLMFNQCNLRKTFKAGAISRNFLLDSPGKPDINKGLLFSLRVRSRITVNGETAILRHGP